MIQYRCVYLLYLFVLVFAFCGCSEGKAPPEPTEIVYFGGTQSFFMGSDLYAPCGRFEFRGDTLSLPADEAIASERIRYETTVEPFCLDRHEVNMRQYEHCVLRGVCTAPKMTNLGRLDRSDALTRYWSDRERYANYPVVGVEWQDARDYCEFRGGRLPTEVEWEYAARRGDAVHTPIDLAAADVEGDCAELSGLLALGNCSESILPLKAHMPAGWADSLVDLYGSVSEWTADEYDAFVGCAPDQISPSGESLSLGSLLCRNDPHVFRRPTALLLTEETPDCLKVPETYMGDDCEQNLSFVGRCIDEFRSCYTDCGQLRGEVESSEQACLDGCFSGYDTCVQACLAPDVQVTCLRLSTPEYQQHCFPAPICFPRSKRSSKAVHRTPGFLRDDPVPHVVKGASFQTDLSCEARPTLRRPGYMAESAVGFRCAFDPGEALCESLDP